MLLTDIQVNADALVRSSDIDQLPPELRHTFWHWMPRLQTLPAFIWLILAAY